MSLRSADAPVTVFGPDFPFAFDDWIAHPQGLGELPPERLGQEVAIVGAGMAGMVAAYELMKLGLKPVLYEASHGRAAALAGLRRRARAWWPSWAACASRPRARPSSTT